MEEIIIVGSGPSGLTAAISLARSGRKPLVLEDPHTKEQQTITNEADRKSGKPDRDSEHLVQLRQQAFRLGVRFKSGIIREARGQQSPYSVTLENGEALLAKSILIASSHFAKYMGIPGERGSTEHRSDWQAASDRLYFHDRKLTPMESAWSPSEAVFVTRFASEARLLEHRLKQRMLRMQQEQLRSLSDRMPVIEVRRIEFVPGELGLHGITTVVDTHSQDEQFYSSSRADGQLPGIILYTEATALQDADILSAAGSGLLAALDCEHFLTAAYSLPRNGFSSLSAG